MQSSTLVNWIQLRMQKSHHQTLSAYLDSCEWLCMSPATTIDLRLSNGCLVLHRGESLLSEIADYPLWSCQRLVICSSLDCIAHDGSSPASSRRFRLA